MAFVTTDKDGEEYIYCCYPIRDFINNIWVSSGDYVLLPKGSIRKLIGRELTWSDEPVEVKGE